MISRSTDAPRDYSTISPSALSLLLMKSGSSIAFAKEAATLLWNDGRVPDELAHAMTAENARRRLRHFENRYRSLDRLLEQAACPNVLEIGSGLSFRGLELTRTSATHYVDTDLPALAALKAELVTQLHPGPLAGTLRIQALDALDSEAFQSTVAAMPDGPLAIANEGLLVYLNQREKARLAANVHVALSARGGRWLTADVYLKNPGGSAPTVGYGRSRAFIDAHRIEQNKFSDWGAAERFFSDAGFQVVDKLAHQHPLHVRESWALAVKP
ncbi:MAG TPA: class I SAM-dependent methyltransferase [Polyangiaceae bacterium]|nr:class I SAM-dependent methyltransferase [Polyangiaceae bacterium]